MTCTECGAPLVQRNGGLACVNLKCPLRGLDADLVKKMGRPS